MNGVHTYTRRAAGPECFACSAIFAIAAMAAPAEPPKTIPQPIAEDVDVEALISYLPASVMSSLMEMEAGQCLSFPQSHGFVRVSLCAALSTLVSFVYPWV